MFRERVFGVEARDLEQFVFQQTHAEHAERDARHNLDLFQIVDAKFPRLLDPVFQKRIAQRVFGLGFRQVRAFDDQAVFAATVSLHGLPT